MGKMLHLDLFSGIGGFAYAADQVFGEVEHIFCDNDKFCQQVLKKHWPESEIYDDIRDITNSKRKGLERGKVNKQLQSSRRGRRFKRVDLLTGGFPCQPFSAAGLRRGTADDRHLWPEMLRVIRLTKPTWVIAENVRGLLTWNEGLVFQQVCTDLEAEGYEVQPLIIPAVAVNAPHRRDRIWFVAHSINYRQGRTEQESHGKSGKVPQEHREKDSTARQSERTNGNRETLQYATNARRPIRGTRGAENPHGKEAKRSTATEENQRLGRPEWHQNWIEVATWYGRMDDGISLWLDRCFPEIISKEEYATAVKKDQAKNLSILRDSLLSEEVWQKLGGQYEVEQKEILLSLLRRIQEESNRQDNLSQKGAETSEGNLRGLRDGDQARRSPHRRQYQEQHAQKLTDLVPQLSYETALEVAKVWDCLWLAYSSMSSLPAGLDRFKLSKPQHRKERLKSLGNAIVPQVAMEIMRGMV